MHVYEPERRRVRDGVASAARRIAVAGVLDRYDVPFGVSAGDGQVEAAVQVSDLDDVAVHHRKAPKTRWILIARELDDLAILVLTPSSGAQTQAAMRVHDRDSPAGGAATASTGILRAIAMAGMERETMDFIVLFITKFSF